MALAHSRQNTTPLLMQWTSNYYRIVYYLVRSPALVFISAIGEIASAYVTIAVSNRVKRAARVCAGNVAAIVPLQWRTVSNRCRAELMNSTTDLFIAFGNVFAIVDRRRLQLYTRYLNDITTIKQSFTEPAHFLSCRHAKQ